MRFWILIAMSLALSACAVHMPDLQEWDVSSQSVSRVGLIHTVYRQNERQLELYTTDMGELAVYTVQRSPSQVKKEYVFVDGAWQRCTITDLEPFEIYIEGEYVSSGFYITWTNGGQEFRTRF